MHYNKQLRKGFSSAAAEKKARTIASKNDAELLENIVWEVNTDWLSDPKLLKPFSIVKKPTSGEVSFDFDSEGNIVLDGEISVILETPKRIPDEELEEWASDNELEDIFMLTVRCDSLSDVLQDDHSINLEVVK